MSSVLIRGKGPTGIHTITTVDGVEQKHLTRVAVEIGVDRPNEVVLEYVAVDITAELDAQVEHQVHIAGVSGHGKNLRAAIQNVLDEMDAQ